MLVAKRRDMSRSKWMEKWMALPRGQRRATIVLLIVASILCVVQLFVTHYKNVPQECTADYSLLEEEIVLFRAQLDTIPIEERRPTYHRRTHTRDTSNIKPVKARVKKIEKSVPRTIEPVPRVVKDQQSVGVDSSGKIRK